MSPEPTTGYIEVSPEIYVKVAELGIYAHMWDDVIDALYDLPAWSALPPAFDFVLMDVSMFGRRQFDHTRAPGMSDANYVRFLLQQADAYLAENDARHPDVNSGPANGCAHLVFMPVIRPSE